MKQKNCLLLNHLMSFEFGVKIQVDNLSIKKDGEAKPEDDGVDVAK